MLDGGAQGGNVTVFESMIPRMRCMERNFFFFSGEAAGGGGVFIQIPSQLEHKNVVVRDGW